jgi:hypothetical protein
MSHLRCPLCGKNAYLESWDPENYFNDIRVTSFTGLGFGLGFKKTEEYSVLGDEDVTPRIVNRMINFLAFLIEEEIINPDTLIKRFNLEKIIVEKGNYIKSELHKTLLDNYFLLRKEYEIKSVILDSFKGAYHEAREKLEKYEKDKKNNERVRQILHWLYKNSNAALIFDEELDYIIMIKSVEPDIIDKLEKIRMETSEDVKKILRKRIKSSSAEINVILEEFVLKKTISISEKLLNLQLKPLQSEKVSHVYENNGKL